MGKNLKGGAENPSGRIGLKVSVVLENNEQCNIYYRVVVLALMAFIYDFYHKLTSLL